MHPVIEVFLEVGDALLADEGDVAVRGFAECLSHDEWRGNRGKRDRCLRELNFWEVAD